MAISQQMSCPCYFNVFYKIRCWIFSDAKKSAIHGLAFFQVLPQTTIRVTTILTYWRAMRQKKVPKPLNQLLTNLSVSKSLILLMKKQKNSQHVNGKRSSCVIGKTWMSQKPPRRWAAQREVLKLIALEQLTH